MGLFSFFKKSSNKEPKFDVSIRYEDSRYDDEYFNLLDSRPQIWNYFGRNYDFPKFTDEFDTGLDYSLRELLLFVWWGNTKNGRKNTVSIPKYFFETYVLNGPQLTNEFIKKGWLIDDGERIKLSDQGKTIFNEFYPLWEIHRVSNYPMCLDIDFPNWNKDAFYIKYYTQHIEHLKDEIVFNTKMIELLNKKPGNDYPGNQKAYYMSNRDSLSLRLNEFQQKLEILKDVNR